MKKAQIFYADIGDYLTREQKLKIIKNAKSIENLEMVELHPNKDGDWINLRNDEFAEYIPIAPEKKFDVASKSIFATYSLGIATNKDYLLYNYGFNQLSNNATEMVNFYNKQRELFHSQNSEKDSKKVVKYDVSKINWTDLFLRDLENNIKYESFLSVR